MECVLGDGGGVRGGSDYISIVKLVGCKNCDCCETISMIVMKYYGYIFSLLCGCLANVRFVRLPALFSKTLRTLYVRLGTVDMFFFLLLLSSTLSGSGIAPSKTRLCHAKSEGQYL